MNRLARSLTAFLVMAAISLAVLPVCAASQHDVKAMQMACCKSSKPACPKSDRAMECCKTTPRSEQQNVIKGPAVDALGKMQLLAHGVVLRPQAPVIAGLQRPAPRLFAGTSSPPRLVLSSLLI